jgi:hypothetical protein
VSAHLDWLHDPVWLIVNALAACRLTRLWTRDSLPPLPRVRQTVIDKLNEGRESEHPATALVDCAWCIGFWIGAGVVAIMSVIPHVWPIVAVPLAFSTVTGWLASRDVE